MAIQRMGDEVFTMKTLLDFLGISRSTLRYYELIGIARPIRDERSNYRTYTIGDIYRIVGSYMLKNAGHSVRDVQTMTDEVVSSEEFVRNLATENDRKLAWHEAMKASIDRLEQLCLGCERSPEFELIMCDTWLAYYDKGETSYGNFDPDSVMAALLAAMPVSAFGSLYDGDYFSNDQVPYRSFRTIPRRFAHLVPELERAQIQPELYGGCPCIAVCYKLPFDAISLHVTPCTFRVEFKAFLDAHGFEPTGKVFSIGCHPIRDSIYSQICLPVRPVTRKAKHMVRRLG